MTEDSTPPSELPDGTRDESPVPAPEPQWPATPAWPDTTVIEPAPTVVQDAETTRLGTQPTNVDPTVPPAPAPAYPAPPVLPVAPSWTAPTPQPAAPQPPGYGAPQHGAPSAPQYGATPPPQYGAPQYGAPPAPQYGAPQYGAPQYGAPGQYGPGQYGPGQYGLPPGAGMPGVAGWGAVPLAPKPGVIPLRPLGVGEILDGAISYIRRDPKTVLGISATVAIVMALLQIGLYATLDAVFTSSLDGTTSDAEALSAVAGLVGGFSVVYGAQFVLTTIATGMLTTAMGRAVLGQRVTTQEAWKRAASRFWALVGLTLLTGLIVSGIVVVGSVLAFGLGWVVDQAGSGGLGVFLGVVAFFGVLLVALWTSIRLLLAPVALILEGVGVIASLRRSLTLVTGGWWRTFGMYLLATVLASIVSGVLSVPFSIVGGFAGVAGGASASPFGLGPSIASALGTLVSSTVVLPFTSGVVALLYIDRRIRREALDIELARAAGVRV